MVIRFLHWFLLGTGDWTRGPLGCWACTLPLELQPSPCHCSWVFFNLEQLLSVSLSFTILPFWKRTGQLFCRLFLNLSLSSVFSWLDSHYAFSTGTTQKWCLLSATHKGHMMSIFSITGGNFDHLDKVSVRFLHCKVIIFLLCNCVNNAIPHQTDPPPLVSLDGFCLNQLLLWCCQIVH